MKLHKPELFVASVLAHLLLTVAGFAPAVITYLKHGRWWVNPITQPTAWAGQNTSTMQFHAVVTAIWLVMCIFQFVLSPYLMASGSKAAKRSHRTTGYIAVVLLIVFVGNAVHLSQQKGVAGKVVNNGIAIAAGGMMLWHLYWAMSAVRRHDLVGHINEMCGLLCWVCFPGMVRAWAILPLQLFILDSGCDSMSTSGLMAATMPLCATGLAVTRHAALGPGRARTQWGDFLLFYAIIIADVCLGLLDGSLFACSERPLLEQQPGQPWKLVTHA